MQTKQEDEGEVIKESEVTFEEDSSPRKSARIPDDKLDEVFTNTRIEDVGVKYDESEEEAVVEQASGNSFEEIDKVMKRQASRMPQTKNVLMLARCFLKWKATSFST